VYERGRAVLGEPGIGKSVLVNRIARMAETDGH
jgi:nucleoside-triphosphatase THEP1